MRELKFRCFYRGEMHPVEKLYLSSDGSSSVGSIKLYLEGLRYRFVSPDSEHIEGIMQFTGIKDKNKVDIFEDDIIKLEYGVGKVIFNHGSFMLEWIDDTEANMELLGEACISKNVFRSREDLEVIGNIHQHKHLLK